MHRICIEAMLLVKKGLAMISGFMNDVGDFGGR